MYDRAGVQQALDDRRVGRSNMFGVENRAVGRDLAGHHVLVLESRHDAFQRS